MKKISMCILLFLLFYIPTIRAQSLDAFFEESNVFFEKYAHHNSVQYKELIKNPQTLDGLVDKIENASLEAATDLEKEAFFINAYNLLVIKNVVTYYPIASPNEIVEFWDETEHKLAGKKYTLDALKAKILEQFGDPLLHFVLVNGSVSAAPIANFAYQPNMLDQQLKSRTIETLNNPKYINYNNISEEVLIPRMFKTYKTSFKPTVKAFINEYRVEKISENTKIKYANEDWTLNAYYKDIVPPVIKKNKNKKITYRSNQEIITLSKNSGELIFFNNIYTINYGDKDSGTRNSYFNSFLSAYYGVSGKFDIGVNLFFRSSVENDQYDASPFETLKFNRRPLSSGVYSDWGLSHIGVQARFAPFKNINLTFEQNVLLPIRNLPNGNTVDESIYSIFNVFYIHPFSSKVQLLLFLSYWQPFEVNKEIKFRPPLLRANLSYFVTSRFFVYVTTMYLVEWGLGVKYMLTPKLEVQAMYSYFIPIPGLYDIVSPGAGTIMTYNLGFRYLF